MSHKEIFSFCSVEVRILKDIKWQQPWADLVVKNAGLRNPMGASRWMIDEIDSPEYIIYGGIFILYFQDEQYTYRYGNWKEV